MQVAENIQKNVSDALDVAAIRADFPIFSQTVYGKPLTFLDSAASAQKPKCVIDAETGLYEGYYANIHRGIYKFSQDATEAYERTRERVKTFINANSSKECIFVRGATEGINLVAQTWGRQNIEAGDEIILSWMEHHSNIVPWQMLAQEKGAVIKVIPVLDDGSLDIDAFHELLSNKTKLLAIAHISNSIGTINPVKSMIAKAHSVGAKTLIDGCQAAPHMKIDVQDLNADFYTFSAHKAYGPTGIGVVYGKETLLDAMPPWHGGGDMISTVSFDGTTYNDLPYKFEAGTPNIAGGIAMAVALDYIEAIGFDKIAAHEADLLQYATRRLSEFNSLRILGTAPDKTALISFVMNGAHPHDVGTILDRQGVAVRVGHHCAQPIMDRFEVSGTVRASFGIYNDRADVDRLVDGLKKVMDIFG
ncbi:cysteine desulfurase [Kordiimonas sp. SCSIO 12610]|uniref:cysteine desulfurase n=1 Tax=Kordiimonas sp. SCSIO 12610 TaxID=2829597 RepID=UPI0021086F35|nr:cysteine desulfurase [Kordiimonas sp. SCSIO 12610]UTW56966.1 cysteine desulfurase [Kordiimonas sp. SCSIO 12610]